MAQLIHTNWRTLVFFALIYKGMIATVFTLLASLFFRLVMSVMGLTYLTRESIGTFLLNPLTLALLLLLVLLAVNCAMIDICAVVYILDCSSNGFRCRMRQVIRFILHNAPRRKAPPSRESCFCWPPF